MKKVLLSIAVTAGLAGSAFAADLPAKAPRLAPAPVVATNWTGCYIGAGGGYGMWNQEHRTLDPARVLFAGQLGTATTGGRGWFGTAQAGCDYQFSDRWVVGVFGDYDFSGLKGNYSPAVLSNSVLAEEKMTSQWAAGGRVGYLVFPQLLAYVSGGYAQARFDGMSLPIAATTVLTQSAQTYRGWFIGSGYEYALDLLPGLFWKTEYRFATYQAETPALTSITAGVATPLGFEESKKYVQTIRSELVWRFNWGPGPVVARY
jgi:outer membrane immunogenic protein